MSRGWPTTVTSTVTARVLAALAVVLLTPRAPARAAPDLLQAWTPAWFHARAVVLHADAVVSDDRLTAGLAGYRERDVRYANIRNYV